MIERSLFSTVHVFAENCRRKYVCSKIFLFLYICKELRERLGIDDIILILQQNRLRWYGHVLRKEDTHWVKKCMEYEVEKTKRVNCY